MNKRIKQIRKNFELSQEIFGKKLGITKSSVSLLESGKNSPSDQTIKLICSEFNVNEKWLRYGEGNPYITLQTNDIVARAASLLGRKDPLFETIIDVYSRLNDFDKEVITNVFEDLIKTYEGKKEQT